MVNYVEAHPFLVFLTGVFLIGLVVAGLAMRLLSRMRTNQALSAFDVRQGILEALSRQAVRYAEEQARKLLPDVKMPSDEKLYLAVEFVKQNVSLAGIDPGPDEAVAALVEGSLAAERKFLEDFQVDEGFDPAVLDAILDGEREIAAARVTKLGEVEPDAAGGLEEAEPTAG